MIGRAGHVTKTTLKCMYAVCQWHRHCLANRCTVGSIEFTRIAQFRGVTSFMSQQMRGKYIAKKVFFFQSLSINTLRLIYFTNNIL